MCPFNYVSFPDRLVLLHLSLHPLVNCILFFFASNGRICSSFFLEWILFLGQSSCDLKTKIIGDNLYILRNTSFVYGV